MGRLLIWPVLLTTLVCGSGSAAAGDRIIELSRTVASSEAAWPELQQLASHAAVDESAVDRNRWFHPAPQVRLNPDTVFVSQVGVTPQIDSDSQTWFLLAPYGWAPAMKGTVGAFGRTANVDFTLSDLVDHIDDLNGALMMHVEMGRGPVGLIFDGMYVNIEPSRQFPLANVTVDTKMAVFEALGMYRVVNFTECGAARPTLTVDVLGGARYYQVDTGIVIDPTPPALPTIAVAQDEEWVDMVVGARSAVMLTDGLEAFVRGDVGGFGIGRSSNLAWNVIAGVERAFENHPGSSLLLGYRVLDIDYATGFGTQSFVFDARLHGPFFALGFRF